MALRDEIRKLLGPPGALEQLQKETQVENTLAKRQVWAAEIVAAEATAERELQAANAAIDAAVAEERKAAAVLQLAERKLRAAWQARAAIGVRRDAAQRPARNWLVATADAGIDEAIARWRGMEEHGRTLRPDIEFEGRNLEGDLVNPLKSSLPSIVAYLSALRDAVVAAEALRLEPLAREEIAARLAQLEASLPNPHVLVAVR
jgi:hypothetical protein